MHSSSVHDHAVVVGPAQGERARFLWNLSAIKARSDTAAGAYGLVESLLAPGFSPPLHVPDREDDAFYVLEGNLTSPGGGEQFFIDGGRPALSDRLPPDEPLDIAALDRAADRYGSRIVGPSLSPTGRANR